MTVLTIETRGDLVRLKAASPSSFDAIRLAHPELLRFEGRLNAAYFACGCTTARALALLAFLVGGGAVLAGLSGMGVEGIRLWGGAFIAALAGFLVGGLAGERMGRFGARLQLEKLLGELDVELARFDRGAQAQGGQS
ncbi:hypothetical protein E5163_12430 [Marinicauda algicola]|uniref:Uncharacterized protein n=1 Tax=Marinicauda algicola TaxID=2029849 RepID=A0A4S2H0K2_9PROT|nr:hypothetical protein [Marinicauda algicola]TGY88612.1 hypothetical protein E5163_12430 [Marinicauda algicola]